MLVGKCRDQRKRKVEKAVSCQKCWYPLVGYAARVGALDLTWKRLACFYKSIVLHSNQWRDPWKRARFKDLIIQNQTRPGRARQYNRDDDRMSDRPRHSYCSGRLSILLVMRRIVARTAQQRQE